MLSTVIGSLTPLSDDLAESMTAEFSLLTPLSRTPKDSHCFEDIIRPNPSMG
jgi:hypothetical protein